MAEHTVVDGHLVRRFDQKRRRALTANELREKIRQVTAEPQGDGGVARVVGTVKLANLRKRLSGTSTDNRFSGNEATQFQSENIEKALLNTEQMRTVARSRNMAFHVLVIPTRGEANSNSYSHPTTCFVQRLRQEGFDVIEMLGKVLSQHYFKHDGHVNPDGAKVAATIVLERRGY